MMKFVFSLLITGFSLVGCSVHPTQEPEWDLDYSRICTFPVAGSTAEPEDCDQFIRHWTKRDAYGRASEIYQYRWIGKSGREVIYEPEIGGFGIGIFTIGKLSDSIYDGGVSFDSAVSHATDREMAYIGVPNDNYVFIVQDIDH